jgi:NTE family protein
LSQAVFFILTLGLLTPDWHGLSAAGNSRPKVGLALSGGGAKGFAHIGILKMIDSLQIPIDYIAGTSMGGIAGALYAIGYNGQEIDRLARQTNWDQLFSDRPPREIMPYIEKKNDALYQISFGLKGITPVAPSGLIYGQNVSLLLSRLTLSAEYIRDFDQFGIPFRCVAADLISGKQVILKNGSLAKALRSTMSIPTVFAPVEYGDSLLIDGGIINNLPVDVVRDMGAEIVIAVNVSDYHRSHSQLKNLIQILDQATNVPLFERLERNIAMADVIIQPEVSSFSPADFEMSKVHQIMRVGEEAAQKAKPQLLELIARHNLVNPDQALQNKVSGNPNFQSFAITGNTTQPVSYFKQIFGLSPGDRFDPVAFEEKIGQIRTSGVFDSIGYQVRAVDSNSVRLIVDVHETRKPLIHGIQILGNETLPFRFIYNLLGVKPSQAFDPAILNRRISDLYALGYFETITYEIEPLAQDRVHLVIRVKERPIRKLRIGFHYDNFYKLVGNLGVQGNNIFLSVLRGDFQLQFAGFTRLYWQISYPSRGMNLPIFPYVRFQYKDIPTALYEEKGKKIANYSDRSTSASLGLILQFDRSVNAEIEYNAEYLDIDPDIVYPDPQQFPSWNDKLRKIQGALQIDLLDDLILPRRGFALEANYEASMTDLYSDINYTRFNVNYNLYVTLVKRHTIRMNSRYHWVSKDIPAYKYFYLGGPETFVGMAYNQLIGLNLFIVRAEYRYEYKKDIFFKAIFNYARNQYNLPLFDSPQKLANHITGYGIGVKFLSIIGPLEFIYARGRRSIYEPLRMRNYFYFQAGYKF